MTLIDNKIYCPVCGEETHFHVEERKIKKFKGYEVNVKEDVAICSECNEEIFVESLEKENLRRLYDKYRSMANIVTPEDIKRFRVKHEISQREMVAILNWGKMTINRYEKGAIPNTSHNDILKWIISNEQLFLKKAEEAYEKHWITEKTYNKILGNTKDETARLIQKTTIPALTSPPDLLNGFKKFNYQKLIHLIGYLAASVELYKTNLNKYLFYIDFEHFRRHVQSITGLSYMRYTFGPIIKDFKYNEILLYEDETFEVIETEHNCNIITQIISKNNFDLAMFENHEIETINDVIRKLKEKNCTEISHLSHQEKAWKEKQDKELIPYTYAEDLKITFV